MSPEWPATRLSEFGPHEEIVWKSEQGYRFVAFIKDITGGRKGAQTFGVNLLVVEADPGVADRLAKKYLNQLIREDPELRGMKLKSGCVGKLKVLFVLVVVGVILYFYFTGRK